MFMRYTITLCACLSWTTGCASYQVRETPPVASRLGNDMPSFRVPETPDAMQPAGADGEEPTGPLQLRDAMALALMRNPELAAFSWEVRAREDEVVQAAVRPNPEASIEVENFAGSGELGGFDASEVTLSLSQLFELGGKRGNRRNVARQSLSLAAWDYETRRVDVLTELTRKFIALLVAQEQAALAGELVGVSEQILKAVTGRVSAGGSSPVEQGRVRVELETTQMDLQRAQREVEVARRQLSATWGSVTPRFTEALGSLESVSPVPPLEDIVARIDGNPDLARWSAELARRESVVALERSRGIPDIEIGIGIRRNAATDDNALVAEVGLPLPIFNRNRGTTRAAEIRLSMAREERRAESVRVGTRLAVIHQELIQTESELKRLQGEVIPQATATYESARSAYQRGRMRLIDVLDTQRMLFALRSRYVSTLGMHHQRTADIERLIGAPLNVEEAN